MDRARVHEEVRRMRFETLAAIAEGSSDQELARAHWQQAYRLYRQFGHPRADELLARLGAAEAS